MGKLRSLKIVALVLFTSVILPVLRASPQHQRINADELERRLDSMIQSKIAEYGRLDV